MKRRTFLGLWGALALAQLPGAGVLPQLPPGDDQDDIDNLLEPLNLAETWYVVSVDLASARDGCVVAIVDRSGAPLMSMSAPRANMAYASGPSIFEITPAASPLSLMANVECAAVLHMVRDNGPLKTIGDYIETMQGRNVKRQLLVSRVNA